MVFVKGKVFTVYLQRQSRVLLRKLRPQRSQENLNCQLIDEWTTLNGFRCVRKNLIQNKRLKPRVSLQKTWNMSKNIDDKEGKQLVFGGNKARGDWVAVKIPKLNMDGLLVLDFYKFSKNGSLNQWLDHKRKI